MKLKDDKTVYTLGGTHFYSPSRRHAGPQKEPTSAGPLEGHVAKRTLAQEAALAARGFQHADLRGGGRA